jgi:hypothetical protein
MKVWKSGLLGAIFIPLVLAGSASADKEYVIHLGYYNCDHMTAAPIAKDTEIYHSGPACSRCNPGMFSHALRRTGKRRRGAGHNPVNTAGAGPLLPAINVPVPAAP